MPMRRLLPHVPFMLPCHHHF